MRIIDYLEQTVHTSPDKVFITQSDGVSVTYQEFWSEVCRKAEILAEADAQVAEIEAIDDAELQILQVNGLIRQRYCVPHRR